MTTLCIDTATENGIVAVVREDGSFSSVRWRSASRHGEDLFGHIEAAMADAGISRGQLSMIGIDLGPGRFTSLRVGLGTSKGLALGLGLPIVGVSSLRVLARSIEGGAHLVRIPVMNAYRGDVFAAAYVVGESSIEELVPPLFGAPDSVFAQIRDAVEGRPVAAGGEGVERHAAVLEASLGLKIRDGQMSLVTGTPDALVAEVRDVFHRYGPSDLDTLEPQYLRSSDAKLPAQAPRSERPG